MIAPVIWMVVWVDDDGKGLGTCGHRHATSEAATSCPFEPADLPYVCGGLVREVRDPEYRTLGEVLRDARQPREQLRMPWRAA